MSAIWSDVLQFNGCKPEIKPQNIVYSIESDIEFKIH